MTKKDFELLAAVMAEERPIGNKPYREMVGWERGAYDEWNTIRLRLVTKLSLDHVTFNADKFNEACYAK
jgi:hypothetical protein